MRSRAAAAVLLLALLAGGQLKPLATSSSRVAPAPAAAPPGRADRAAAARDVVLITIDTLRADATGFGGNPRGTTPVLDRLAAGGRVFTAAHAHNVVTLPSHTNILTGLYPFQHGVRDNTGFRLPAAVPTLATVLHEAGFATAAFVGAYPLDSEFGLGRGFEVYDDHYPKGGDRADFVLPERRGDRVVAPAVAWWRANRERRRFLWVHLFDPHAPYTPPEPFASRFADSPYLGEVAAADSFLEPLLGPFLAGAEAPALIVVTGDHGEALGDHGELTHGLFAYESTLHIPLLLWGAGISPGRDGRPARHVDIFPTVLQAAGLPPSLRAGGLTRPGRALQTLASENARLASHSGPSNPSRSAHPSAPANRSSGGPDGETSYFEALSACLTRGWAPLRGVVREGVKLIALPLPELYDLPRDPPETHNLVASRRQLARELAAALPAASAWPPPGPALKGPAGHGGSHVAVKTPARSSRPGGEGREDAPVGRDGASAASPVAGQEGDRGLLSLGYVAAQAPAAARYSPDDDPKRLIGLDRRLHQAIDLYSRGRLSEAVDLARGIVAQRPAMPFGHSLLAQSLLEAGRKDEALTVMRQARARGVASDPLLCQLGLTLAETGHGGEAVQVLQPLAAKGIPRYQSALGLALSEAGRQDEARAVLERASAAAPGDPTPQEHLALVDLRQGRWQEARERASRALKLNDRLPLAWNDLGVALFRLHEPGAALDAWQRAVDLDPHLLDALWNLGIQGAELGRVEQARRALHEFISQAPPARYGPDLAKARDVLRRLGDDG